MSSEQSVPVHSFLQSHVPVTLWQELVLLSTHAQSFEQLSDPYLKFSQTVKNLRFLYIFSIFNRNMLMYNNEVPEELN